MSVSGYHGVDAGSLPSTNDASHLKGKTGMNGGTLWIVCIGLLLPGSKWAFGFDLEDPYMLSHGAHGTTFQARGSTDALCS